MCQRVWTIAGVMPGLRVYRPGADFTALSNRRLALCCRGTRVAGVDRRPAGGVSFSGSGFPFSAERVRVKWITPYSTSGYSRHYPLYTEPLSHLLPVGRDEGYALLTA